MISKLVACEVRAMKKMATIRQVAWILGASATLAGLAMTFDTVFGRSSFSEALISAAFPMALMCSSECGYMSRYSAAAWGAVVLGDR